MLAGIVTVATSTLRTGINVYPQRIVLSLSLRVPQEGTKGGKEGNMSKNHRTLLAALVVLFM